MNNKKYLSFFDFSDGVGGMYNRASARSTALIFFIIIINSNFFIEDSFIFSTCVFLSIILIFINSSILFLKYKKIREIRGGNLEFQRHRPEQFLYVFLQIFGLGIMCLSFSIGPSGETMSYVAKFCSTTVGATFIVFSALVAALYFKKSP